MRYKPLSHNHARTTTIELQLAIEHKIDYKFNTKHGELTFDARFGDPLTNFEPRLVAVQLPRQKITIELRREADV